MTHGGGFLLNDPGPLRAAKGLDPTQISAMTDPTPNCLRCQHFFVTWEPARPRGCRALGFKCRGTPSQAVRSASGQECQYFQLRDPGSGRAG